MTNNNSKPLKQPYYRSLIRNMVLIFIIVSFTPGIIVYGIILNQYSSSYSDVVFSHLKELVQKHRQNIDSFLSEKIGDIQLIMNTSDYETLSNDVRLENLLNTIRSEFGQVFVDLGLINDHGVQTAYAGPYKLKNADYKESDWFKKAINSEFYTSDVFLGLRGHPHFIVAVRHKWQNRYWVLKATINFETFNSVVENLRVGKTGFAFILNRKGELQTKTHFEIKPDEIKYDNFFKNADIVKNEIQFIEAMGKDNVKYIYVGVLLKGGDWLMIFRQSFRDALDELIRLNKITLIISLLGGLSILIMSYLLSRRIVNRISIADREKEMMNQQVIETGKLASVGELAAEIAHEINNPVAIMVEEAGWIQDLLEEEDFKESDNLDEFKRALRQINTQGKRCKEITHKLLSFARKTDSRIQEVNINELIEDIISISSQRARYKNVKISTDFAQDLAPLKISQSEMQQVVLNMINNALDALDKKGDSLRISTERQGDNIFISFKDNGPGIHPDHLARIFDPFFTTKPLGKGTGLGLSICYGIINKAGGEIDVKSAIDIGTTFKIRLPISKD